MNCQLNWVRENQGLHTIAILLFNCWSDYYFWFSLLSTAEFWLFPVCIFWFFDWNMWLHTTRDIWPECTAAFWSAFLKNSKTRFLDVFQRWWFHGVVLYLVALHCKLHQLWILSFHREFWNLDHHASPNLFTCIHVTNPLCIVSFTAKLKVFLSFNYFQHSLICMVTYSTQGTLERNIMGQWELPRLD